MWRTLIFISAGVALALPPAAAVRAPLALFLIWFIPSFFDCGFSSCPRVPWTM